MANATDLFYFYSGDLLNRAAEAEANELEIYVEYQLKNGILKPMHGTMLQALNAHGNMLFFDSIAGHPKELKYERVYRFGVARRQEEVPSES